MDMKNLVLRPNCLITPSELIFVPGPRSLFFYQNPFGQLPDFLYEHGYRTRLLPLPFRNPTLRLIALKEWLKNHSDHTFHFIMDEVTYNELEPALATAQIQSLTVITDEENTDAKSLANQKTFLFKLPKDHGHIPFNYRLHQVFNWAYQTKTGPYDTTFSNFDRNQYDRFLDHCVKLAENELYA